MNYFVYINTVSFCYLFYVKGFFMMIYSISISSEFHSSASLIVDFVMDIKSQIQNYKTELTNHCEFSLLTLP